MTIANYRYYEVLRALRDNPSGLTTSALLKWCRSQTGSELPNDSSVVSRICYNLRVSSPRAVHSSDCAGGKLHKITPHGLELLKRYEAENDLSDTDSPVDHAQAPTDDIQEPEAIELEHDRPVDADACQETINAQRIPSPEECTLDPNDEIESALITMANYMRHIRQMPAAPRISRKDEKLKLLRFLQSFHGKLNDDVDQVLADIINDLDALEAA